MRLLGRDAVLRELRALAERLRRPVTSDDINRGTKLYQSAMQYIGSLPAARRAAGLSDPIGRRPDWSKERVLNELRKLHRTGVSITGRALTAAGHDDVRWAAYKYAGGLVAARKLVRIAAPTPKWTRKRVIEELRAHYRKGHARIPLALESAVYKHIGSLRRARSMIGVAELRRTWSRRLVIAELRRHGNRELGSVLANACRHWFGTVGAARAAAGMPVRRSWNAERLVAEIRKHGSRPLPGIVMLEARRFFGSTAAARRAAGIKPLRERWTRDRTLELLAAAPPGGIRGPLASACRRHFGSIAAARRALARRSANFR